MPISNKRNREEIDYKENFDSVIQESEKYEHFSKQNYGKKEDLNFGSRRFSETKVGNKYELNYRLEYEITDKDQSLSNTPFCDSNQLRNEKYQDVGSSKPIRVEESFKEKKESNVNLYSNFCSNQVIPKILREVYVGNLPIGLTVTQLLEFINKSIVKNSRSSIQDNPVISAWINSDGKYAFCECRSVDDANALLKLNNMLNLNGNLLRIGKPKIIEQNASDFNISNSTSNLNTQNAGIISSYFNNIPLLLIKKEIILLSGIHKSYSFSNIKELFKNDGKIQLLELLNYQNKYKIAICEIDSNFDITQRINRIFEEKIKILKLKDLIQNNKLINFINKYLINEIESSIKANRLFSSSKEKKNLLNSISPSLIIRKNPCRCILISKLLNIEELVVSNTYNSIYKDIEKECLKFGEIVKIVIPRPKKGFEDNDKEMQVFYGNIFIFYKLVESAIKATMNLYKMRFLGRNLKISYFSEEEFFQNKFLEKIDYMNIGDDNLKLNNSELLI